MNPDPDPIDGEALVAQAERLRRLARGLVRDEVAADDVAQETCLRALTGSVHPRRSLAACLGGVVRNVASRLGRGEARRARRERAAARPEALPSTADLVARLDLQRRVLARVQALEEPYRGTLLLRYFEGLTPKQIAALTDVPVETVKTRLRRALTRLRTAMDAAHGGSRRAWMAVLLPVAGFRLVGAASTATAGTLGAGAAQTGGLVSQGIGWKGAAGAVGLLLLAGGGLLASGVLDARDGDPGAAPDLMAARAAEDASDAAPDAPTLEGAGERTGGATTTTEETTTTGSGAGDAPPTADAGVASGTTQPTRAEVLQAPPAIRRSPFGLPRRGRPRAGTRSGWGGPTGHWMKFMMPKPRGRAAVEVAVTDAEGRAVAGADVYLGPPEDAGVHGISFGDLRTIGRTGADGRLRAEALPHGGAAVFANYRNRLNGPGGLDGRSGGLTILEADATARVALTLPFAVGATGAVRGRVLGTDGEPLVSASVSVGWQRVWTRADGAFAFEGVPAGEQTLSVSCTGYASQALALEVAAGKTLVRDVKLAFAERGDVRIEGRVVGPEGEPVPNANVYLMITRDRGTNRATRTDAQGRFVLDALPERVRTEKLRLQAGRVPTYAARVLTFEAGIQDGEVTLELPVRYVRFGLRILDAETGAPVETLSAIAERPESRQARVTLPRERATGLYAGLAEAGRHHVTIDALDYEDASFDVDVRPDAEYRFTHTVKLRRLRPPTRQIHLTVRVVDAAGAALESARIELQDATTREPMGRFEGRREGGVFLMPGLSGTWRLVVTAAGHEPYDAEHRFETEPGVADVTVRLRPR